MPFVRVSYIEDRYNDEQLACISECIMVSLIENFHVPEDDCFQTFQAHRRGEFYYHPNYLLESDRTEQLLYIQVICGSGRTTEQKKALYRFLSKRLENHCHIKTSNVFIVLVETSLENWSFGHGLAQMIGEK